MIPPCETPLLGPEQSGLLGGVSTEDARLLRRRSLTCAWWYVSFRVLPSKLTLPNFEAFGHFAYISTEVEYEVLAPEKEEQLVVLRLVKESEHKLGGGLPVMGCPAVQRQVVILLWSHPSGQVALIFCSWAHHLVTPLVGEVRGLRREVLGLRHPQGQVAAGVRDCGGCHAGPLLLPPIVRV